MTLLDRHGRPLTRATLPAPTATRAPRQLAGGRLSYDTSLQFVSQYPIILPPPHADAEWQLRVFELGPDAMRGFGPAGLLQRLTDISPDVSRATWDFLRFCNAGYTYNAFLPGTEDVSPKAQAALDAFWQELADRHGSPDVVIDRLFFGAWLRGAFMAELVLDEAGRLPLDLATPDPATARFQSLDDPVLGREWQLGQYHLGQFVLLDRPTIRYIPVDPFPGSPYGRPIVAPALHSTLFLLGILHDLRRVIAQQGWPRVDLSILTEKLPAAVQADDLRYQAWIDQAISDVTTAYSALQPDDAFVHPDTVQINQPAGGVNAEGLGMIGPIIDHLERWALRALKTMPLLMGITDGVSEANANRQWEAHLQGIKSLQHFAEVLLEGLLKLGLQAQGIQAEIQFRFAENRASEMQRDALTQMTRQQNAYFGYLYGYLTQEQAAQEAWGHEPATEAPLVIPATDSATNAAAGLLPPAAQLTPEPGANRQRPELRTIAGERLTPFVPAGAHDVLPPLPTVTVTPDGLRRAANAWDAVMEPELHGLLEATVAGGGD